MDLSEETRAAFAFLASEFPDETPALSRLVGNAPRVVRGTPPPATERGSTVPKGGDAIHGSGGGGRVAVCDPPPGSGGDGRGGSTVPSIRRYDLESERAWDRVVGIVLKSR